MEAMVQVRVHRFGEPVSSDRVLYEESDPAFFVDVKLTKDRVPLVPRQFPQ
jgi:protease II